VLKDGAEGVNEGCVVEYIIPVSRLTRFGAAVFPAKNSPAVSAGSDEGAAGKISDWKESA